MKTVGVILQVAAWITFGLSVYSGLSTLMLTERLGVGLATLGGGIMAGILIFGIGSALITLTEISADIARMAQAHEQTNDLLKYFFDQTTEANDRSTIILEYLAQKTREMRDNT